MFCMECGAEISSEAEFCAKCGTKVDLSGLAVATIASELSDKALTAPLPARGATPQKPAQKIAWYRNRSALIVVIGLGCLLALFFSLSLHRADIVGTWTCQTQNPNGSTSQDIFTFSNDGSFENNGSMYFSGTYEKTGHKVTMTAQKVRNGSTTMTTNLALDGTITVIGSNELQFGTVVRKSGNKRSHSCTRVKEEKQAQEESLAQRNVQSDKQNSSQKQSHREDKVAAYANNLANELEQSPHPACRAITNKIRSFGNSSEPDYTRVRFPRKIVFQG